VNPLENRKKHFAVKILIGPEDELAKAQDELRDEDVAPALAEVDAPEKADPEMASELMGGAERETQQDLDDGEKPRSLKDAVRMNIMKKKDLLKYAKIIEEEQIVREKLKKIRDQAAKAFGNIGWTEHHHNGIVLEVTLAAIMGIEPEEKPTWHTFETSEGGEKGYFRYGPIHVGEIRPGFHAWVKHETQSVVTKEAPTKVETAKESEVAA